jgi:hypothetical protein
MGTYVRQTVPAGWYPDPEDPTQQRYWDGGAWTQNLAPAAASTPAAEAPSAQDQPARPVQAAHSVRQLHEARGEDSRAAGCLIVVPFFIARYVVPVVAIAAVASGLFNLGIPLLPRALQWSVLYLFAYVLLFMPLNITTTTSRRNRVIRQTTLQLGDGENDPDPTVYEEAILANNAFRNWQIAWLVMSAIAAFLLHDPLMSALGNPWADVLTIAILVVGFQLSGVLVGGLVRRWILANDSRLR